MSQSPDIDNARNLGRFLRDLIAGKTGHEAAALMAAFREGTADQSDEPVSIALPVEKRDPRSDDVIPLTAMDPAISLLFSHGQTMITVSFPDPSPVYHVYIERHGLNPRFYFDDDATITFKPDGTIKYAPS